MRAKSTSARSASIESGSSMPGNTDRQWKAASETKLARQARELLVSYKNELVLGDRDEWKERAERAEAAFNELKVTAEGLLGERDRALESDRHRIRADDAEATLAREREAREKAEAWAAELDGDEGPGVPCACRWDGDGNQVVGPCLAHEELTATLAREREARERVEADWEALEALLAAREGELSKALRGRNSIIDALTEELERERSARTQLEAAVERLRHLGYAPGDMDRTAILKAIQSVTDAALRASRGDEKCPECRGSERQMPAGGTRKTDTEPCPRCSGDEKT